MMKLQSIVAILGVVILIQTWNSYAQNGTRCNTRCMDNNVQCTNYTYYHVCINGEIYNDIEEYKQQCPPNTYCSDAPGVCMPANTQNVDFVCGSDNPGNGKCGECEDGDIFTCVDRTHFTMCQNRLAYVACDGIEICNSDLMKINEGICIAPRAATQLGMGPSCSLTTTTTSTTVAPPTTPDLWNATITCMDAIANRTSTSPTFFYIPNVLDSTCRTYIYCSRTSNSGTEALVMRCSSDKFYSNAKQTCTSTFVSSCL